MDAIDTKEPGHRGGDDEEEENKKEVDELADMLGNLGIAKAKCSICMSPSVSLSALVLSRRESST